MLEFLEAQLAQVKELPPEGVDGALAQEFRTAVRKGERLIDRHKGPFDLKIFYTSDDVYRCISEICDILCDGIKEWHRDDTMRIERELPRAVFEADKKVSSKMLNYVIDGKKPSGEDVPPLWERMKDEHDEQMRRLDIIDDAEVRVGQEIGKGACSSVYEGTWKNVPVAVKKSLQRGTSESDVGHLVLFWKDVLTHLSLSSFHVAGLHAITKSSWLVMELADKDLQRTCQETRGLGWPVRLKLLQQAAEALKHLHSQEPPLMHGDVKTANFLVFQHPSESFNVKIADFGLTCEISDSRSKTARKGGGTVKYLPPEYYQNQVHSLASDIYSLGVVMYEVVTGRELYPPKDSNRLSTDYYIMKQKLDGNEPCEVKMKDCPPLMLDLMRACILLNAEERPKIREVCERLWDIPYQDAKENSVEDLHRIVDSANQQLPNVRYNKSILSFLLQQMECVRALPDLPPDMPSDAWKVLKDALEAGEQLVNKHAYMFDLQKFYLVDELKVLVENVCTCMQDSLCCVDEDDHVGIENTVPSGHVARDRGFLHTCLHFVLFGEQTPGDVTMLGDELHQVRKKHKNRMRNVLIIPDDDIDLKEAAEIGTGGEGTVYRVQWRGRVVAAKWLNQKHKHVGIERLAQVFTEAALSASLLHDHVASILAVNASGDTLVMELASENLMDWYRRHKKVSWRSKVDVMYQAATGLAFVHNQMESLVHCDVKTTNFLVFVDDSDEAPLIKLCDFGTLTTQATDLKTTLRQQPRTALYCAPEIYARRPHTQKSDVFSFGVVLCEVAAQRSPYRGGEDPVPVVMMMKQNGEMPCRIPSRCPPDLRRLIEQCLSREPGRRPTMQEVEESLVKVLQELDPGGPAGEVEGQSV